MHRRIKLISFWNDTLHVSDGLFVHQQEFKTVHTAVKQILLSQTAVSVWQMPVAVCTVFNLRQQYLFDKCLLLYVQSWTCDSNICLTNACCCMYSLELATAVSVWQMPVAVCTVLNLRQQYLFDICLLLYNVCTVLNSWRWTERPSGAYRVSFQNKINLIRRCIWLVLL